MCTYRKTNKDDILALAILLHVTEYGNDNTAARSISSDFKARERDTVKLYACKSLTSFPVESSLDRKTNREMWMSLQVNKYSIEREPKQTLYKRSVRGTLLRDNAPSYIWAGKYFDPSFTAMHQHTTLQEKLETQLWSSTLGIWLPTVANERSRNRLPVVTARDAAASIMVASVLWE